MNIKQRNLIGVFTALRKHIMPLWLVALAFCPAPGQHSTFYSACQMFEDEAAFGPGVFVAATTSTVRDPYIGRDGEGDRTIGTDLESESGFARDAENGDRTFRVKPRKHDDADEGPQTVIISPEVRPGRHPYGQPGHNRGGHR